MGGGGVQDVPMQPVRLADLMPAARGTEVTQDMLVTSAANVRSSVAIQVVRPAPRNHLRGLHRPPTRAPTSPHLAQPRPTLIWEGADRARQHPTRCRAGLEEKNMTICYYLCAADNSTYMLISSVAVG